MVRWSMRKLPNGLYEGMITLTPQTAAGPWSPSKPLRMKAQGKSKAAALAKASSVADKILANPLIRDALPPGSQTALAAVKYLSKSAAAGKLEKAAKKIVGKGAKRLFKKLKKFW